MFKRNYTIDFSLRYCVLIFYIVKAVITVISDIHF